MSNEYHDCFLSFPTTRREMLLRAANGFGAVALAALAADPEYGIAASSKANDFNPLDPRMPHFQPRAKNIIFLYMDGGPSHVDTFDPKPQLEKGNRSHAEQ